MYAMSDDIGQDVIFMIKPECGPPLRFSASLDNNRERLLFIKVEI